MAWVSVRKRIPQISGKYFWKGKSVKMKEYKIYYGFSKSPNVIAEILYGDWHGNVISFYDNQVKLSQEKWKLNTVNGICKSWSKNSKNEYFLNYKKNKHRGIEIGFF